MEIKRIRRENLLVLLREAGGRVQLAKRAGTAPAYVSQLKSSRTKAHVGHDLARRLEKAYSKPVGWMDARHDESDTESIAKALGMADEKIRVAVIQLLIQLAPETERILAGVLGRIDPRVAGKRATGALDETHKATNTDRRARRQRDRP